MSEEPVGCKGRQALRAAGFKDKLAEWQALTIQQSMLM